MFWQIIPIIVIAVLVLALVAIEYRQVILAYVFSFISKQTTEAKPKQQNDTVEESEIKLSSGQVQTLFDKVLPEYYSQVTTVGNALIYLEIVNVGIWFIDTKKKTVSRSNSGVTDVSLTVGSIHVFNEILNREEFTETYAIGLVVMNRVKFAGDKDKLLQIKPLLKVLSVNREEILKKLQ